MKVLLSDNESACDDDDSEEASEEQNNVQEEETANIEFDDLSESDSDDVPLASFASNKNPKWANVNVAQPTIIFTKSSSVAKDIQEMQAPTSYAIFSNLFTDNIIEHIAFHTNLYAVQSERDSRNLDRLYKARSYLEMIINNLKECYCASDVGAVDESMFRKSNTIESGGGSGDGGGGGGGGAAFSLVTGVAITVAEVACCNCSCPIVVAAGGGADIVVLAVVDAVFCVEGGGSKP
ncbi:Hypothetical predicted protein [Octopus vulgaris]|uniref:PiggyBac transposable element-derived protein domain-containing protein n=1 Tax=Octopus vulgaris TaxID=6645 RepID=A0AA36AK24_OCTVU|nr:Hypothetical predicted protein [Octopus vulgaris]